MYKLRKSNVVILSLFLVAITALSTFFVTTLLQVNTGDKVVISQSALDSYQSFVDEYREVEELKNYIEQNYYKDVTDETLVEGMKKGIFEILNDPYSVFMNDEEFKDYMESSSGEYPGIGIYLAPNDDNEIEIVSPIEDTPADRAGLIAKDLIIGVNGDTVNADVMDEAIATIKGEPGTPVTLTIYRPSNKEKFDVEIVREWIDIKVAKSRMLDDQIGYLRLTMFDEHAAAEFEKHMDALFIDPDVRGSGVGKRLVEHALLLAPDLTTNVNEQNEQAIGFYLKLGFRVTGRSEKDDSGRSYPLLHLRYQK